MLNRDRLQLLSELHRMRTDLLYLAEKDTNKEILEDLSKINITISNLLNYFLALTHE